MMAILWDGLREESRRAVASPIPEEPPVMTMVFGADLKLWKAEASGWKRDMFRLDLTVSGRVQCIYEISK